MGEEKARIMFPTVLYAFTPEVFTSWNHVYAGVLPRKHLNFLVHWRGAGHFRDFGVHTFFYKEHVNEKEGLN